MRVVTLVYLSWPFLIPLYSRYLKDQVSWSSILAHLLPAFANLKHEAILFSQILELWLQLVVKDLQFVLLSMRSNLRCSPRLNYGLHLNPVVSILIQRWKSLKLKLTYPPRTSRVHHRSTCLQNILLSSLSLWLVWFRHWIGLHPLLRIVNLIGHPRA